MKELIEFNISDAKIERLLDDTTCICSFRVITEGDNRHHLPIALDVIKAAAERSLRGKPIVSTFSDWDDDLESHKESKESNPIGYIIENQEFQYREVEDGKRALYALGLIWKYYSPKEFGAMFNAEEHTKKVSMEISVKQLVDDSNPSLGIADMDFLGICILGDKYTEASPNAHAQLLTFAVMKDKYEKMIFESGIKINNTKEAAINSAKWSNPGRALYGKLLDKPNEKALVNEAYLVVEKTYKESPSQSLKYPHHKVKKGELVIDEAGLKASFQRARQQGIAHGGVLAHIKRHYKELGLDMENFSTEFVEQEVDEMKDEEKVMMEQEEEKKEEKFEDSEEEKAEEEKEDKEDEKEDEEDFACKYATAQSKIAEYEVKMSEYESKFAESEKELSELRKYKEDREEQDKKFQIEQVFAEVQEFLPKDEMQSFRDESEKVKFAEVETFKNKVKARSLDFAKQTTNSNTQRMAIVNEEETKKESRYW